VDFTYQEAVLLRAAINAAYMKSSAEDLVDSYKALRPSSSESRLTTSLRGALDIVEYHIANQEVNDASTEIDDDYEPVGSKSTDSGSSESSSEPGASEHEEEASGSQG
jgi:hypothetical protein